MDRQGSEIVGIGFMGMIHYLAAQASRTEYGSPHFAAVTPKSSRAIGRASKAISGRAARRWTSRASACYSDFEALLADPQSTSSICASPMTPTAQWRSRHSRPASTCWSKSQSRFDLRTKRINGGRRRSPPVSTSWSATSCRFSPSLHLPSRPSDPAGTAPLRAAHLIRVISKPDWSSGIADPERSGGPAIDLHIHDTHFIGLICWSSAGGSLAGVVENGAVVHLTTQYLYDTPNLAVSCVSGALSQAGRPFAHGFELYFDRATLAFEFANLAGQGQPPCR